MYILKQQVIICSNTWMSEIQYDDVDGDDDDDEWHV